MRVLDQDKNEVASTSCDPLSYLTLADCERLIKNEFESDDELLTDGINFPFSPGGSISEALESPKKQVDSSSRKNKRKTLTPQRAVQLENSQSNSLEENSSECSQDIPETLEPSLIDNDVSKMDSVNGIIFFNSELPESDLLFKEMDEENIFKGIQEEADGEKLDDEMIDNVKEEWRAHWGVKCNMCEKVFPYKTEFDNHYLKSYNATPVYTCAFCNKSAEKYSTFRSHCYRHITEGRYKCNECDKGFTLQSMLHVHVVAKHSKAKPFKCEECGKSFVTKPGLKIHIKKHKGETKEEYPCFICGKVLHTRGGLTSHINVHRLGRRFMCDVCGKTFTQKVNMQQHAKQHTGDKPYACDKCSKTFAEKSHLARHYSFHSNQRPFKCEVCQKMYKTERCLKVHSMVHSSERPFVCIYCNKGFLSSTKLKQHYNVHTGERPYACKYCERKFTNYPNWLKHTRRRHRVDHKTGEELAPKVPKEEPQTPILQQILQQPPLSSVVQPQPQIPIQNNTLIPEVPDSLTMDFTFSKADELFLQQGLLNYPETEDKFTLQQDLFSCSTNNSMGYLIPTIPNQTYVQTSQVQQNAFQIPLVDFSTSQLLHNTLPCD